MQERRQNSGQIACDVEARLLGLQHALAELRQRNAAVADSSERLADAEILFDEGLKAAMREQSCSQAQAIKIEHRRLQAVLRPPLPCHSSMSHLACPLICCKYAYASLKVSLASECLSCSLIVPCAARMLHFAISQLTLTVCLCADECHCSR